MQKKLVDLPVMVQLEVLSKKGCFKMIIFCFMGAPGAGKGTQAEIFSKKMNLCHISTGEVLRKAVREKTNLGLKVQNYISRGQLVPDHLMMDLIEEVFNKGPLDQKQGFILDGFPRTSAQAQGLSDLMEKKNITLSKALLLTLPADELMSRITGRRIAPSSGRVYHIDFRPPKKAGICDQTGEKLIQREDDQPAAVQSRLTAFLSEQKPLTKYYKEQGLFCEVSAEGRPSEVSSRILKILEPFFTGSFKLDRETAKC